jgi:hypothetical protein
MVTHQSKPKHIGILSTDGDDQGKASEEAGNGCEHVGIVSGLRKLFSS